MPGYNVRPMDLQAAIGLVQLRRADEFLHAREALAGRVNNWARRYAPWLRLIGAEALDGRGPARRGGPAEGRRGRRHSWMTLPFELTADTPAGLTCEGVKAVFESYGVETRPIIAGNLARHPGATFGVARIAEPQPVSDRILERGFMIGCHPRVPEASVGQVEKAFRALGRPAAATAAR
jgi:CDP-4-dehydro-6-deoxyglucose reductase, E1